MTENKDRTNEADKEELVKNENLASTANIPEANNKDIEEEEEEHKVKQDQIMNRITDSQEAKMIAAVKEIQDQRKLRIADYFKTNDTEEQEVNALVNRSS